MATTLRREPIQTPYEHGERYTFGNRMGEALRCYAGAWAVYYYVDGTMERDATPPGRYSYSDAVRLVREFVAGGN